MGAYAAAVDHYERTLELWEQGDPASADLPFERVDVVELAAEAAQAAGDYERALEFTRQALVHVDPRDGAVRIGLLHARRGSYLYGLGLPGADEAFERALLSVPTDPPSEERASVLADFAETLMLTGQDVRARSVGEEALEVARTVSVAGAEAQALSVRARSQQSATTWRPP